MITRQEELVWKFELDPRKAQKHLDILSDIPFGDATMEIIRNAVDGDLLKSTYTIHIGYVGSICKALNAIIKLQKKGIAIDVNEEELNHGHCLIRDVFKAIDKIKKRANK